MPQETEHFLFTSLGLQDTKFYVVRFSGTDCINSLFFFEIQLICRDFRLDTEKFLTSKAVFTILREHGDNVSFVGYPAEIIHDSISDGYSLYTVKLFPALHKLTQIFFSGIFLNCDPKGIMQQISSNLSQFTLDYEFRLTADYPVREFSMLYKENVYDYLMYKMQEEGIYFYFEQGGELIIFTDNKHAHTVLKEKFYYLSSREQELRKGEYIYSMKLTQSSFPKRVIVRDYDWKNPNRILVGISNVSKDGSGTGDVCINNRILNSEQEAKRISSVFAEAYYSESRIFSGTSTIPALRSGYIFALENHPQNQLNQNYLITEVHHEGSQEKLLFHLLGISKYKTNPDYYKNSFTCREAGIQYRPKPAARTPIYGSVHAFIDGVDAATPLLDSYGRYKVIFPFDLSERHSGKASGWVRRIQEQSTKDGGVSFPLLPGTEVLVVFAFGNPDYPVIKGALPNGETGSISGSGNNMVSGIRSSGGPQLTFDNANQGMNLSNLTGSGIRFSSDKMEFMNTTSSINLTSASVMHATAAGYVTDTSSFFYTTQSASCGATPVFLLKIGQIIVKSGLKLAEAFTEKSAGSQVWKEVLTGGASLIKILTLLHLLDREAANVYILGGRKKSKIDLLTFPTKEELLGILSAMLLTRGVAFGAEYKDGKTKAEKQFGEYKEKLLECMRFIYHLRKASEYPKFNPDPKAEGEYYRKAQNYPCACYAVTHNALREGFLKLTNEQDEEKDTKKKQLLTASINKSYSCSADLTSMYTKACEEKEDKVNFSSTEKRKAVRYTPVSIINSVLPEIAVLIALIVWKAAVQKKKISGVIIDSPDKNVNLMAQSVIGMHAERGVYITTRDTARYKTWGAPSWGSTPNGAPDISEVFREIRHVKLTDPANNRTKNRINNEITNEINTDIKNEITNEINTEITNEINTDIKIEVKNKITNDINIDIKVGGKYDKVDDLISEGHKNYTDGVLGGGVKDPLNPASNDNNSFITYDTEDYYDDSESLYIIANNRILFYCKNFTIAQMFQQYDGQNKLNSLRMSPDQINLSTQRDCLISCKSNKDSHFDGTGKSGRRLSQYSIQMTEDLIFGNELSCPGVSVRGLSLSTREKMICFRFQEKDNVTEPESVFFIEDNRIQFYLMYNQTEAGTIFSMKESQAFIKSKKVTVENFMIDEEKIRTESGEPIKIGSKVKITE